MSKIDRYLIIDCKDKTNAKVYARKHPGGEFVLFADHQKIVARRKRRLGSKEELLNRIRELEIEVERLRETSQTYF